MTKRSSRLAWQSSTARLSRQRIRSWARAFGRPGTARRRWPPSTKRWRSIQVLIQAYDLVTGAEAEGRRVAPAGEWLLDNFYLIEQQIRLTRLHLPRTYSRELPRLLNGAAAGFPRVYDIALDR